jgi:hypothetical protein
MMQKQDRAHAIALRAAGWLSIPLCYLVMLSVVLTAARRLPAGR